MREANHTALFEELLNKSKKILIISHFSPDPDAISSILLTGTTLMLNYPDKTMRMSVEESSEDLNFLEGYKDIVLEPLEDAVSNFKPDLIIMVDAMNFGRCTRGDWQKISSHVKESAIKLAIIDHHEKAGVEESDVYLNSGNPATVQESYELLFNHLKLKKPEGYAQTTMVGLYADTGGFVYLTKHFRETLALVSDLIEAGVSLEALKTRLNQYTEDEIKALGHLAENSTHEDGYSYSFFDDVFVDEWISAGKPLENLHAAIGIFVNGYVRNIDGRVWGFVLSKDPKLGANWYSVSMRSIGGAVDVSAIATKLNGGGHKPAAGGKVQANSVEEAISKVKQAINS